MLAGGLLMLAFAVINRINVLVIMLPVIIFIIGSSMVFPNAYAGAFHPFPQLAGTASALFGFLQMLGGAVSSMLLSFAHTDNQIPLSIALVFVSLLSLFFIVRLTRHATVETETLQPSGQL